MTEHDYVVVGADPGKQGALVSLAPDLGFVASTRFPPHQHHGYINTRAVIEFLGYQLEVADAVFIVCEKAGSRRTDFHGAAFSFGGSYGALLAGIDLVLEEEPNAKFLGFVPPITWKTHFGLRGKGKQGSLPLARKITGLSTKDHNTADAALIAAYGATKLKKIDGIRY